MESAGTVDERMPEGRVKAKLSKSISHAQGSKTNRGSYD